MKSTLYPDRKCRQPVWTAFANHACEVVDMHDGPCATPSVPQSVKVRDAWEEANPDWYAKMQGEDPNKAVDR